LNDFVQSLLPRGQQPPQPRKNAVNLAQSIDPAAATGVARLYCFFLVYEERIQ
jgi:hypothetical protein